jgi:hypothetical protein
MWGLFVVPVIPYAQLDAVLSPEELADREVRDSTLAMLKKASGNQWLFCTLAGVALGIIASIGLRASGRLTLPKPAAREVRL